MTYNPKRALELLQIGSGRADSTYREGQEDANRHIVDGRCRLLVVQKTGWGKSFIYFIATKLLREGGNVPALLISPLLDTGRPAKAVRNLPERALQGQGCQQAAIHDGVSR